ncbi:uncharacterized protein BT62DRAFT_925781 [Guyanagaster necrorhizus]|uniref:Uncharacterized protein n=1 Tax=Guyanagaster necrorhizus TaxID=856835 RepID=A0A9P7W6L8_9AGAR|nr:uncharacterized protein BT62DRAFT_925781 [Guyanagaster necrorhizus MCA 3950]KAG7453239.1 hypothetical protein BT62DRAFT_925781 [Guyanagaster necrorhizus MCA 3950]
MNNNISRIAASRSRTSQQVISGDVLLPVISFSFDPVPRPPSLKRTELSVANTRPNRRAANCTFPTPPSTNSLSSPKTIEAGESFDVRPLVHSHASGPC